MMKYYRIESEAGIVFGVYAGDTEDDAYESFCEDAGSLSCSYDSSSTCLIIKESDKDSFDRCWNF